MSGCKQSLCSVFLTLLCSASSVLKANFTLPIDKTTEKPLFVLNSAQSGSSFDYPFQKRPPWYKGTDNVQSGFLLVPVLRYLIMVDKSSITMDNNPVAVLLSVVLETATHWWFNEEQLFEQLNWQGETPIGDPILVSNNPIDGSGAMEMTENPPVLAIQLKSVDCVSLSNQVVDISLEYGGMQLN